MIKKPCGSYRAASNTQMRRVECGSIQREGDSWKSLMRNHLKTTSEWPQSGPVTPLSSNEVVKHSF